MYKTLCSYIIQNNAILDRISLSLSEIPIDQSFLHTHGTYPRVGNEANENLQPCIPGSSKSEISDSHFLCQNV